MKHTTTVVCALVLFGAEAKAKGPVAVEQPPACEQATTVSVLARLSMAGDSAFASFDTEMLKQTARDAEAALVCLNEPVTQPVAASYHRLMALAAFVNGEDDLSRRELHASYRLEDTYVFPTQIAPEGHPLLVFYEEAKLLQGGSPEDLYPPIGGYVTIDGEKMDMRPSETPVIVQAFSSTDELLETHYVLAGQSVPRWGELTARLKVEDLSALPSTTVQRKKKPAMPWLVAGGAALALGGVTYGIAMDQHSRFLDTSSPDGDGSEDTLNGYMNRANTFGASAIGLGVVGVGLMGTGVVLQVRFGGPRGNPDLTVGPEVSEGGADGP